MRRFVQAFADVGSFPDGLPEAVTRALVDAPDRYNVGQGKPAAVIATGADGAPVVLDMIWGLVPRWSREPTTPYTTITARLERAPRSRIFAQAWRERRCIVAMSGYYKWDRQRKPAWPRFIQSTNGLALLTAGIWERWEHGEGEPLHSFSLLTGPNPSIPPPLTQDGPVFLAPPAALRWLAGDFPTPVALGRHAHFPSLESYPVGRQMGNPLLDDYTLLEPVDPDAEPPPHPAEWDEEGEED